MQKRYESWGRCPGGKQSAVPLTWRHLPLPLPSSPNHTFLPFGNGRSYGDCCLNHAGILLDVRGLDHFMEFDPATGVIRCEAGGLLSEIMRLVVPKGWFLPVLPGTGFVTVGGAIANDIHGKNHHRAGTFGCHVLCLELLRSDKGAIVCSPDLNGDLFRATIGGLGLTGLILWAEIALKREAHDEGAENAHRSRFRRRKDARIQTTDDQNKNGHRFKNTGK